ncbi:MAG: methylglyoxal synthase [Spirulinaceae cyanobacterium SM2_1_0]|nr:methylglyoxal synthase [Spirulinaceae cyanobacterium SM2_1_0]
MPSTIALIAHDSKKPDIVDLAKRHIPVLSHYHLIATGTTGQRLQEQAALEVERLLSGPLGGDAQIAARVAVGEVRAVIFLIDPLYSQPHEPDIQALLRVCEVHDVAIATNLATAEILLSHLARLRLGILIFNPVANRNRAEQDLQLIRDQLTPHFNLKVWETTPERDGGVLAREAREAGADLVIAAGGDGTVSAVAGALMETGIPLGIIPRGTANAFCSALRYPQINPIRSACQLILQGKTRVVDAARCNGQPMILLAGIGYEAEVVEKATRERKEQWGVFAYLVAGWQQLNEQKLFEAEIEAADQTYQVSAGAIAIANAAPPTSVLAQGVGEVVADDGLLDVTVATVQSRIQAVSAMADMLGAALVKGEVTNPNVRHGRTRKLRISTDPPQKVAIDGEVIGTTPVEIECFPQSLIVFAPPVSQE